MTIITKKRQERVIFSNVRLIDGRSIYCYPGNGTTEVPGYFKGIEEKEPYLFPKLDEIPNDYEIRNSIISNLLNMGAREVNFTSKDNYKNPIDQLVELEEFC